MMYSDFSYDYIVPIASSGYNFCYLYFPITLGRHLVLPKRQIRSVEEFFREFPEVKETKEALLREKESNHA